MTPTLSDAVAERETVPESVPPVGLVIDTVGAVVSLKTVTETTVEVVTLPEPSYAFAVNEYEVLARAVVFHDAEYGEAASEEINVVPW